ncbi:MAG: FKBP-type peptidyl-prolyl cis-trans isomerase [Proteobacteria bacterium]|nr:FKBP-type peptidyl-prolyl cis-trans isomerase [Pseudomonadota bacterium]
MKSILKISFLSSVILFSVSNVFASDTSYETFGLALGEDYRKEGGNIKGQSTMAFTPVSPHPAFNKYEVDLNYDGKIKAIRVEGDKFSSTRDCLSKTKDFQNIFLKKRSGKSDYIEDHSRDGKWAQTRFVGSDKILALDFVCSEKKSLIHYVAAITLPPKPKDTSKALNNLAAGKAFLKANAKKTGVITTNSGLQYKILKSGNGKQPKANDDVIVHYTTTLIDGREVESTHTKGVPVEFHVGGYLEGWDEALQLMHVGDKWKLFLPTDLAWGEHGRGESVPENTPLVIEIELLKIGSLRAPLVKSTSPSDTYIYSIDISGIKLGMTPNEVKKVLSSKKNFKGFNVDTRDKVAVYDKAQPYVELMTARSILKDTGRGSKRSQGDLSQGVDSYKIYFSMPPFKNVVNQIRRSRLYYRKEVITSTVMPSTNNYKKALIKKYGSPLEEIKLIETGYTSPIYGAQSDKSDKGAVLRWLFRPKECIGKGDYFMRGISPSNIECPAIFDVQIISSLNRKTQRYDGVEKAHFILYDYPLDLKQSKEIDTLLEIYRQKLKEKNTFKGAMPTDL